MRTKTTKDEVDALGLKQGRRIIINVSGVRQECFYEGHNEKEIHAWYNVPESEDSHPPGTIRFDSPGKSIKPGRKVVTYQLSDIRVESYTAVDNLPVSSQRFSIDYIKRWV